MIRKILSSFLLFLAFFAFPAFPAGGALSDSSSPLHVIRTQYFDIIFPEECRESARKIEAVCDDYYLEITKILETDAYQRFPVTITRSVEVLNAYYAAVPYNRIVLYDTLPETSLDMYEETIQSVFYHELTHAVTYNMKGKKLRRLSFISDAMTPAWTSITTFWAEGATVSFESKGKGGRLNDPFSTQMVNQSVIEERFPSWRDVTGARDTYPGGTDAYMFGAMFASYLQETYGMSKYADFWKNAHGTLTFAFVASVFKKTYGMKISEAWEDFEKTLEIEHAEKNATLLSDKKARITTFDAFFDSESQEVKIAYFDAASSSLRLLTLDTDGKITKNKKLLAITGLTRLAFSPDGKKLALSRNIDKKNYKCVTAEYDFEQKKYIEHAETGKRDGFFKIKDEKNDFADISIQNFLANPKTDTSVIPSDASVILSGSEESISDWQKSVFNDGEIPFSPIGIDENLNAAIVKDGLNWKIRLFDDEKSLYEYDFSNVNGKNLIIHKLHKISADSQTILLSFSWAALGEGGKMLSRIGLLKINRSKKSATCFLQKENTFAGVLEAIPEKLADDSFFFYVLAAEYEQTPLYRLELKMSDFETVKISASAKRKPQITQISQIKNGENDLSLSGVTRQSSSAQDADPDENSSVNSVSSVRNSTELSYNPFRYYRRGFFLPLIGNVPVYSHDFERDSSTLFGLTFVSTNPWGDRQISFSAGYDIFYNEGGLSLGFSGGDDSFQYSLSGTAIFDKKGFMQTVDSLELAQSLWRGRVSYVSAGLQGNFLYGRQIVDDDIEKNRDDSAGKSLDALAYLQFSNIHKISPAVYNSAGFLLQPFVLGSYRDTENLSESDKYVNAGATAQARFPIFVPFIFTASLFPSSKYCASASVKAILADFEIHKGIPAVSLFMQRVVVSAGYAGKISYKYHDYDELWAIKKSDEIFKDVKKDDYSDAISLNADLYLSPNTGFVATGEVQFSIGYALIYRPNPKSNEKRVVYGLTVGLNY